MDKFNKQLGLLEDLLAVSKGNDIELLRVLEDSRLVLNVESSDRHKSRLQSDLEC